VSPLGIAIVLLTGAVATARCDQFAFLKDGHIFIADSEAGAPRQVDRDPREKEDLQWDPKWKRFSYFVRGDRELAHLVVVDLTGRQLDVPIRPSTGTTAGFMRFVESSLWLPDGRLRVTGSINPSNCEQFDFDVATRQETNIQYGYCSGIVTSPDGAHTAEISPVNQFVAEAERYQILLLDNEDLYFGQSRTADQAMFIVAGPVWAPDGKTIALLEKKAATGEGAVTFVKLDKSFLRIPAPRSVLDAKAISWVGGKVVVGVAGREQFQIDPVTKHMSGVTADVLDALSRKASEQEAAAARRKRTAALVDRYGGKDGILLDESLEGSK
jgi:Tol biopolymer transport system component